MDLDVQLQISLKMAPQVDKVAKNAYRMLTCISQGIQYNSREVMAQLYKALVRPHLEYCLQF